VTRRGLIIFRCDASPKIGGGHVARCLGYADAFTRRGWEVAFVTAPGSEAAAPGLARTGYRIIDAPAPGDELCPSNLAGRDCPADVLVLDLYAPDAAFDRAHRGCARRLVAIDDLADRSRDCDILVNTSAGIGEVDYAGRVPAGCQLLLGPAYAPLLRGFAALRPATLARREQAGAVERVLVSFGLTDPDDATSMALLALKGMTNAKVDVVLGSAAPHLERVRNACEGWARLHANAHDMPALMAAADLSLGAAGASAWERCCLGLPTIVITIADNQRRIAAALDDAGAAIVLGQRQQVTAAGLRRAIGELIAHPGRMKAIARAAATLCDGQGADRALEAMAA
jgi:UDP-2,4-diacetamido-2,4,6-trideoxy-beta-L-altropyranose hydrolase